MEAEYTGSGGGGGGDGKGKGADDGGKQIPDIGDAVSGDGQVKVACRLRPLSATEVSHGQVNTNTSRQPAPALRPAHTSHSFIGHTEIVVVSEKDRTICIDGKRPPHPP